MTLETTELRKGHSWLAIDESGRRVVHKRLPDDCCPRGQMHPSVKLRLQRLRELPLGSFVNILGVERTEQGVVLVSEWIDGVPLDQTAEVDRPRLLRELRLAVMSMHQHGMVHGSIKPGNVIVDLNGQIKLIDPSPLLHDDPKIDLKAVDDLDQKSHVPASNPTSSTREDAEDRTYRQQTVIWAVALAVVAIGVAVGMSVYLSE